KMLIFKFNDSIQMDSNDLVILDGQMDRYLINIYLNAIITDCIDLNQINPIHIFDFLKFVEQYPVTTQCLSMEYMENQLIQYIDRHGIELNEENKRMFERCNLKLFNMYVNHNKLFNAFCYGF